MLSIVQLSRFFVAVLATAILGYHIQARLSTTFLIYFLLFCLTRLSHATALLDYHISFSLSTTFFKIFPILFDMFSNQRRKRDLNPRAATNDLLPFQGSPFSLLGISPTDLFP